MIRKTAKVAFLLLLIIFGTVFTVADHLFIGVIIFIAMIVMVATGPKPGQSNGLSDLERAKSSSQD